MEQQDKKKIQKIRDLLEWCRDILLVVGGVSLLVALVVLGKGVFDDAQTEKQQQELRAMVDAAARKRGQATQEAPAEAVRVEAEEPESAAEVAAGMVGQEWEPEVFEETPLSMLPEYAGLYQANNDLAGWLWIPDTGIDYPVMQTPEDPYHYLRRDFYGKSNSNGCLFADTASVLGKGKKAYDYAEGNAPGTNLIIYGHHMRSREMFGRLDLYAGRDYGMAHNIICFDTLYEHREYQLVSVFLTQIYHVDEEVFKYYQFFRADTEEQFYYFYDNIKQMSLYDTGVTAEFGDEFISLSTCDDYTENGRLVVVGKRIL
ncbi:MAG: class B sortase [Lachnospiraceae bacterium]|nr:class B sortase [Lachnospiraceae bacterium]